MGGWVDGWVTGWVSGWGHSCQITKYEINLDLIKIIQFYLKIYDLWRHSHLWVSVWVVQWVNGWVGGWGQVKSLNIE